MMRSFNRNTFPQLFNVKKIAAFIFLGLLMTAPFARAATVRIPDPKFLQRLIALGYDKNGDDKIQEEEIAEVENLNLRGLGLINLEGIRAFKGLVELDVSRNPDLTRVDVSGLANLKELNINWNGNISSVNLSGAVRLEGFYAMDCGLRTLELKGITWLVNLMVSGNQLSELDVSQQRNLNDLRCARNRLRRLDIRGLSKLADVWADGNQIDVLLMDGASGLQFLELAGNRIASCDLTRHPELQTVVLTDNPLTGVKVRGLRKLKGLFLAGPSSTITTLDLCGTFSLEKLQW